MGMNNPFPFLFPMELSQIIDSIPSVWINLGILHGNDCLFPFRCSVILGIELKKK